MGRDFYAILEVPKNASADEIRTSYKKLARKFHPDLNPNAPPEKFTDINDAYETLSDANKRELFDKFGEEGMKDNGSGGMGFEDFGSFFGFPFGGGGGGPSGRRHQHSGPQKGETVRQGLPVTLEELYNGATRKIRITRTRICKPCDGIGATKKEAVVECKRCNGVGIINEVRQVAPGFVTQSRRECNQCEGAGKTMDKKFICKSCNGKKVVSETKTIQVDIDKGMKNEQKIVFENEADERPGVIAGDIQFILQEKSHAVFKRDGQNLIIKKKISLSEALTGVEFVVNHLDKRKLLIKSAKGEVIKPGQIKQIKNEGMPQYRNPFDKGLLLIQFDVEFPEKIPMDAIQKLSAVLGNPNATKMEIDSDQEEHYLEEPVFDSSSKGQQRQAYDSDDEEDHRGQGVSCGTQ